jgi:hypothetical protein
MVLLLGEHNCRERRVRPTCLGSAVRGAIVEDDRSGAEGEGERQEHQRSPLEQVPQKMVQTRHDRDIDCAGRNSGRFPYESRMSEPKIPNARDE